MSIKLITAWVFCALAFLVSSNISTSVASEQSTKQGDTGGTPETNEEGEEGEGEEDIED